MNREQRDRRNALIIKMYAAGEGVEDIAAMAKCSIPTVYGVTSLAEVPRFRKRKPNPKRIARLAVQEANRLVRQKRYETIRDKYASGLTLDQLGAEYGVSRERIRQILKKVNYTARHNGYNSQKRIAARAAKAAVKAEKLAKRAARQALIDRVRELYDSGMRYRLMCQALGMKLSLLQKYIGLSGGANRQPHGHSHNDRGWGHNGAMNDKQREELADRFAAGDPIDEIATSFGVSKGYVYSLSSLLGRKRNTGPEAMRRFKEMARKKT